MRRSKTKGGDILVDTIIANGSIVKLISRGGNITDLTATR